MHALPPLYQHALPTSLPTYLRTHQQLAMDDSRSACTACRLSNQASQEACSACQRHSPSSIDISTGVETTILAFSARIVPRLIGGAISAALTSMFAIVGAFTGAVIGAFTGRATESGLLRGAGVGAVAGAVLSVEVFEASRAYWCSGNSGSHSSLSMAEYIEDVMNGRIVQEEVSSTTMVAAHRWQVNMSEMSNEELYEMFGPGEGGIKGASEAALSKLPCHIITAENDTDTSGEKIFCAICLQELQHAETARSLPLCHHTFHMSCVDKWLTRHGSCPVCRQHI